MDVPAFTDQIKDTAETLQRLQESALQRAEIISLLHDESVRAFLQMHDARQRAATLAQWRHENAQGLPHGPVPFQVEIPECRPHQS